MRYPGSGREAKLLTYSNTTEKKNVERRGVQKERRPRPVGMRGKDCEKSVAKKEGRYVNIAIGCGVSSAEEGEEWME